MIDENLAQPQEGTNLESEVINDTVAEETTETPAEEVQEETVPKSQFNQVLARAKRAEDEAKRLKASPVNINKTNSLSPEEVDVKILQSQGYTDELITELKAVAKARGKSLFASTQDSIFIAIKAEKEAELKAQKAKLGASRGSSSVRKEKSVTSPNLSDEEHKQLWRESRDK